MLSRIGEVEIWRVLESIVPLVPIQKFLPDLTDDLLGEYRHLIEPHGLRRDPDTGIDWIVLPIQAFLLRTPRNLILIDACVGNDKTLPTRPQWHQQRSGRFMAALSGAGAAVEDVTHVMCTHLHVDHVGWTTTLKDGRWVPTFPNARVMATQADLDHARAMAEAHPDHNPGHIWRESIEPLLDDNRFDIVTPDHELDPAIRLRPTPGHTPGHVAVEIAAPSGHAPAPVQNGGAITGDLMHTPLQCALPDQSASVDWDPQMSAKTRQAFMEDMAEQQRLVMATHFPLPSIGHIDQADSGFIWQPCCG